ncbi:MAG TPA: CBS domain-containing protein [Chitinophagaceae bacterium]|nr:CBS domain-containing protein [Chitinophagaceae bacterium]
MLNREIISASIPTLNLRDSVSQALELMSEFHLSQLPVVMDEKYLGLVFENDLLNMDDAALLQTAEERMSGISVKAGNHFLDAVRIANEYQVALVPVVENDNEFAGAITGEELLRQLGKMAGAGTPGGLIVLEIEQRSFSFSEISKLIETNDAQITQLNTYWDTATDVLVVTIRINKFEISDIIATFQRYEYQIKYYFGEELYENELKSNFDHLMNYLNI